MEKTDWNRAWSPEEIVQHADSWSLAGDAALLNTIKKFSENLQTNTERISKQLDNLLNNLDEAALQLDLARNKFHSLRNVQFMESRVYEDDETLDSKTEEKDVERTMPEDEQDQQIIDSIKTGMKILDEYYDKIEVSVSDSEDESERSFVLQPKDRYSHRPLPPIIGTEEWYKNELDENSSDSGSDQVSEVQSESESEEESPNKLIKGSETSSELGFSSHINETGVSQKDDGHSEEESVSEGPPLSFAEQLAAKLGDIISQQEEVPSPEVNTKPIQPKKSSAFTDLFSDEPPPLEDSEDLQKTVKTRLFSGGTGLFDDNEDEELWHEDKKSADFGDKEDTMPKSMQVSKGLFDNDQSSDEDIFSPPKLPKQPFLKSEKPNILPFTDEPPVFEKKAEPSKKKPVGAVSLFGSHDLFDDLMKHTQKKDELNQNVIPEKKQRRNLFDDDNDDVLVLPKAKSTKTPNTFDESKNSKLVNTEQPGAKYNKEKSKRISLFDDDHIPEVKNTKKTNIFNEETSPEQSIFDDREPLSNIFENKTANRKSKKISLFDDDDDDEEWRSERGIPDIAPNKVQERPKKVSLFDDEDMIENKDTEPDIMNKEKPSKTVHDEEIIKQEMSKKLDLFDDEDNDNIESKEVESNIFNIKKSNINIITEEDEKQDNSNNVTLFEEDDTESRGVVFTDDKTATQAEENIVETNHHEVPKKVSLFADVEDEIENQKTDSTIFNKNDKSSIVVNAEQPTIESNKQERPKEISIFDDEDEDLFKSDIFANLEASIPSKFADLGDNLFEKEGTKADENTEDQPRQSPIPFNMSPPPDDEGESDTGSDRTLSEQEDISSYSGIGDSVVFYDEPPFLDSGITSNFSTRLSSLDSTFNPSMMSSRRLSSDIFNEDQSNDEFFVTKSKSEEAGPYLNVIPEQDNATSFLDITPSGHPEDFDTTEHDSVESPVTSDTTPEERSKDKITSIRELLKNESEKKIESKEITAPGKLKHNLNINVSALMPGSTHPQKMKDIQKSQSLETDTVDNSSGKRSLSFDDTIGNVEVLQSITKDRVRIPIKRKPSTRRGRQTYIAVQQDECDEKSDGSEHVKNETSEVEPKTSPEKTSHDPNLFVKEETTATDKPSKAESPAPPKQSKRPLFDDEDSDQDLFERKQAPRAPTRKSLFNDSTSSSEDDDLFKSAKSQKNELPKSVLSKGTHKGSMLKKLENVETSEDPLSNLLS